MKASLRPLILGLVLLVPFSTAHAQAPLLSPIANISLNAGLTMNVNVVAVDVGGRPIAITAALPPFATLNTPTIGTGVVVTTLTLAPSSVHVGDYTAAVTATSGGVPSVRVFQITINAMGSNQAPMVMAPPLREVTAETALSFTVTASDADGDAIASLSASGLPAGATFTPNGSNTTAMFDWTPGAGDAGEYDVLFTASNGLSATAVTHIRVASPPTLTITPIDDVTVAGGESASVPVHAEGVPGALITLTAALPTFATLDPPGTGTGVVNTTVTVSPPTGSAGTYHASISATSLGVSVTEPFDIIVTGSGGPENHAPVLTAPATETVAVAATLSFDITATDADGDHVDLFGSALPPGSSFIDNANETGTFTWTPVSGQAGTYTASFTGVDHRGGSGSASTSITVTGGVAENHAPVLTAPATETVAVGSPLSFNITATDADGDHVDLFGSALPPGSSFIDNANETGTFTWTPVSGQAGTYTASFTGVDNRGGSGSASTSITVTGGVAKNHAPTLSAPATEQVNEGVNLSFTVTASDQDGDHVALSANSVPPGATFSDHGDNTGAFSWTPGSTQSGTYEVAFLGNDGHGGTGTTNTSITVVDVGGGGGGEVPGKACLIKNVKAKKDTTCFRISPVNRSFDVRDVVLSSIRLRFHGESLAALGNAWIELRCHKGNGDGDDGDNDDQGEHGDGDHHGDGDRHHRAGIDLGGDRTPSFVSPAPREHQGDCIDDGHDECRVICSDPGDDDGGGCGHRGGVCDTLGIRASFSTKAVLSLFAGATLPCALVDAEILATLTNCATVVATFDGSRHHPDEGDKDRDKDRGKGKDKDGGKDGKGDRGHCGVLSVNATPNPLSPATQLSFTMSSEGRVRVTVYDMQGRLVKKLLDEFRPAGQQRLAWDGSNEWNLRVASGVYFFRIEALEGSITHRVAVVK